MPSKPLQRSRTGCLTCRLRKLKCDETKPVCTQCSRAGRECQPSSGIVFRHHQNASMNGGLNGSEEHDLESFYAYKDTFTKDDVWLPIPPSVTFIHIQDPYADEGSPSNRLTPDRPVTSPASAVVSVRTTPVDTPSPQTPRGHKRRHSEIPTQCHSFGSPPTMSRPLLPRDGYLFASTMRYTPPLAEPGRVSRILPTPPPPYQPSQPLPYLSQPGEYRPRLPAPATHVPSPLSWGSPPVAITAAPPLMSNTPVEKVETDIEVLFLLRHFAGGVGRSMDLFDSWRFFSDYVPTRALYNPLLMNAACAYAAKQLAMVGGNEPQLPGFHSNPARTELWPTTGTVDWATLASKYYGKAMELIIEDLKIVRKGENVSGNVWGEQWQEGLKDAGKSDDLMAATAILCEYEAIDASGAAWQRHLSGTKSLLDIAEAGMRPIDGHPEHHRPHFSRARRAIFWNFARQDFAAALITESEPRLDTSNHQLWRNAGLELDENGRMIANKGVWINYSEGALTMREDMLSNGLILILSKLCKFVLTPSVLKSEEAARVDPSAPYMDNTQQMLLEQWNTLYDEFNAWYKYLPITFKPIGRAQRENFEEIWYGVDMCAAAMAQWHMAHILLLVNRPNRANPRRSDVNSRLQSYQAITEETQYHSREICGIALARPGRAARIFIILPLFYAGQCFRLRAEREVVRDLLRDVEKELGWATEYRVQHLIKIWGWA